MLPKKNKQVAPYIIADQAKVKNIDNPYSDPIRKRRVAFEYYFREKIYDKNLINIQNNVKAFNETDLLKAVQFNLIVDKTSYGEYALKKTFILLMRGFWDTAYPMADLAKAPVRKDKKTAQDKVEALLNRKLEHYEDVFLDFDFDITEAMVGQLFKNFISTIAFYFNKEGAFKVVPQTNPNTQMVEYLCFLEL